MDSKLIGITDLRSNAKAIIDSLDGQAVTVLSRSKPVAVLIHPDRYEAILERLQDLADQVAILTAEGDRQPYEIARKEILDL